MAKITYGDEQPVDSVGKKFAGVVTDNGGANEFVGIKGVNRTTQNGKVVADMSVAVSTASGAGAADGLTTDAAITTDTNGTRSGYLRGLVSWFARLGGVDGSAFTSGSSYVWAGLGGVYQSTVTTLAAGKSGLARLTARRALVTAGDVHSIELTSASPVPSGSDITTAAAAALTAAMFSIRSTSPSDFLIPLRRTLSISFVNTLDVSVNLSCTVVSSNPANQWAQVALITVPSGVSIGLGTGGSAGIGGIVGSSTAVAYAYYSIPAIAGFSALVLNVIPASAPTTGAIKLDINRGA